MHQSQASLIIAQQAQFLGSTTAQYWLHRAIRTITQSRPLLSYEAYDTKRLNKAANNMLKGQSIQRDVNVEERDQSSESMLPTASKSPDNFDSPLTPDLAFWSDPVVETTGDTDGFSIDDDLVNCGKAYGWDNLERVDSIHNKAYLETATGRLKDEMSDPRQTFGAWECDYSWAVSLFSMATEVTCS